MGMICAILLNLLPQNAKGVELRMFFEVGWGFIPSVPFREQWGTAILERK